jgi:hypothetical protein
MFGLSFLYPWFLLAALAAAVPVVLHLLRRRRQPSIPFTAVRLLRRSQTEQASRRRLRELLLLGLRVAALLLVASAFARPFFDSSALGGSGAVTLVAVDTSFSMSAPGLFERAKALAREELDRAPAGHSVAVVGFDETAHTKWGPSPDRAAARAAVERLQPGAFATSYGAVLEAAHSSFGDRSGRMVFVTDQQASGWDGTPRIAPRGVEIYVREVEAPVANLFVSAVERHPDGIVAIVNNEGESAHIGPVRLEIDGEVTLSLDVAVPGKGSTEVMFSHGVPDAGSATVEIEDEEGFAADNRRYLVLDPPRPFPVLIVTSSGQASVEAFYLEAALDASEPPRFATTHVSAAALSGWPRERLLEYSAVILMGTRRLEQRGRDLLGSWIEGGGGLLVTSGPDVDFHLISGILSPGVSAAPGPPASGAHPLFLVPDDPRHPVFRPLIDGGTSLGRIRFARNAHGSSGSRSEVARKLQRWVAGARRNRAWRRKIALLLFGSEPRMERASCPSGIRTAGTRDRSLPLRRPSASLRIHQQGRCLKEFRRCLVLTWSERRTAALPDRAVPRHAG